MKVQYISVYKLHGANKLPEEAESASLVALQHPALTATLTTNPEPYFLHMDRSEGLRTQLLKPLYALKNEGSLEDRLVAEIEGIRASRAKKTGAGVFLVFDGETNIPEPELKSRRDYNEFGICIDAIEKPEILEAFRPSLHSVITALSLSLPANAARNIEKVGDVVFLVDPDGKKPIYAFTAQVKLSADVASPLTQSVITESAALAPRLAEKTLARPTSLLFTSLEKATGELQGFIAAWSALEIFVNATFKSSYEKGWSAIMAGGAPASAKPLFKRFQEVMSNKYRLVDKFLVIASVLDADHAADDAAEFRRLKKLRDGLFHVLDAPSSPLPTEAGQKLLLKYMKLHLGVRPEG